MPGFEQWCFQRKGITSTMKRGRPTFYFRDQTKYPIRAAGVLLYKKDNGVVKLLVIHETKEDVFTDIGGKTDKLDQNIKDTVYREVQEETNGLINMTLNDSDIVYCGQRYLFYFQEATEYYNTYIFGDQEDSNGHWRTFHWINAREVLDKKIKVPRIMCKNFITKLEALCSS